jgi:hypothetical protein
MSILILIDMNLSPEFMPASRSRAGMQAIPGPHTRQIRLCSLRSLLFNSNSRNLLIRL